MTDMNVCSKEVVDETITTSMQIILSAGNARDKIMHAMDLCKLKEIQEALALLAEAKQDINQAHGLQTQMVQKEAKEEAYYYSMLFTHAQDTVMTVQSEYNVVLKIVELLDAFFN